ncbi:MAG: class I SAM-dependent methyltransferase [Verrucomicrobiae bacterium]|nr:class I SAM-dependent methyltransferase [Verrucomicrobiae bacterium]
MPRHDDVSPPLVIFEDEHLLVVSKPPGMNTHAPGPYAGEGLYDWLRRRAARWEGLAIVQRLDKETSGLLVFPKTRRAAGDLTRQFAGRAISKEYTLVTDRRPAREAFESHSWIRKGSDGFESSPRAGEGLEARTRFQVTREAGGRWWLRAEPLTGRTHQIRLHAAEHGVPILGDVPHGGTDHFRLCLHASRLGLKHPETGEGLMFQDETDFGEAPAVALRRALIEPGMTDAWRVVHGAADGRPGWFVDRLGDFWLASVAEGQEAAPPGWLLERARKAGARGVYRRWLQRHVRGTTPSEVAPVLWWGEPVAGAFPIRENGLTFLMDLSAGYSAGLFLDQRDNRRRLRVNWVGPDFPVCAGGWEGRSVLNVFAYTCGFSVAAAAGGARTASLDLSRRALDWGRRNFAANGMDPSEHEFLCGDAMDWFRRLARKGRRFDVVLLDPPTFSQSRERGVFRAESDYAGLVTAASAVLGEGGVLFASTNAARLDPERFVGMVRDGLAGAGRPADRELYVPQPPDMPITREEPGHLKTLWIRVGSSR